MGKFAKNLMGQNTGVFYNCLCRKPARGFKNKYLQPIMFGLSFMIAVSSGAHADKVTKGLVKPASFEERWTGVYGGVSIGGGWGQSDTYYNRAGNDHLTGEGVSPSGFLFAINAGYNYTLSNNFVVGFEGDIGMMNLSAPDRQGLWDGHIWKSRYGGMWGTLRGRAGYIYNDFLIYGTAGLAFMETDEYILGDNDATQNTYNANIHTGWVAGIGVEYAITDQISTKLEFLHMQFPEYQSVTNNNESYGFKNSVSMVRVGLNYRF